MEANGQTGTISLLPCCSCLFVYSHSPQYTRRISELDVKEKLCAQPATLPGYARYKVIGASFPAVVVVNSEVDAGVDGILVWLRSSADAVARY